MDSADPLRRNGGIELRTALSIPGLITGATFDFQLTPSSSGTAFPDFSARARVGTLDLGAAYGGLALRDVDLFVSNAGGAVTLRVSGTGTFLGQTVSVDGVLNPDLSGEFHLTAAGGLRLFGLDVNGSIDFVRTPAGAVTLAFDGTTAFLGNSLTVLGNLNFTAAGTPTGTLALRAAGGVLDVGGFRLGVPAAGSLRLTFTGSGATIEATASVAIPGLAEAGVAGSFNTATGAATLALNAFGGLRLGPTDTRISGTFSLVRTAGGSVFVSATNAGLELGRVQVLALQNFQIGSTGLFAVSTVGSPLFELAPASASRSRPPRCPSTRPRGGSTSPSPSRSWRSPAGRRRSGSRAPRST